MAAEASKMPTRRRSRPLYHAAKISERRFKQVLWHFARDGTAAEAAQITSLSVNAVNTLFQKLRRFFVEAGMFTDIYQGKEPTEGSKLADEEYEFHLIEFHFARMKAKRQVSTGQSEDDHWCESHWRFHYAMLVEDRGGDAVHHMMHRHLLEMIRRCGPVGRLPVNRRAGLQLSLTQMDQRIAWAVRNSQHYTDLRSRAHLRSILAS